MTTQPVLIDGRWQPANVAGTFQATNPRTKQPLPEIYPVSDWSDCEAALTAAAAAFEVLSVMPGERIAAFLEKFADQIEARADDLVEMAHAETALPKSPRLADGELPRTTGQIRQSAEAARTESWRNPVVDADNNIRSCLAPIGPVCVFGPNNFPFAFGSASGGDFATAIAAGNPVIAKANSSHPGTTRLFAEIAAEAAKDAEMPSGIVQLIYRTSHADGERLVADARVGATGYTGSRVAGLKLKAAADAAGKPIYLELSSVNPVVILPGSLDERFDDIVDEFTGSCLMGTGQFCTNPGLVILMASEIADRFTASVTEKFASAPVGTLLSQSVEQSLRTSLQVLMDGGAEVLTGNSDGGGEGFSRANTLLRVAGTRFLAQPALMQTEAFGNCSLVVTAANPEEAVAVIDSLEGNLTGCIYSASNGDDDELYDRIEPRLRRKVGRLLNDKMPTGVAVSPAMNHGGPFPATGHPYFTAVGIPAAITRFCVLHCYDNVRPPRLPSCLRDKIT